MNDETESVTLTGECNPASIIGGSIRSDLVANMKVTLKGSGSVNDGQKQGLLSWVLGKLWPF
ncbi:MAG: hypothetical protein A2Z34_08235 [Planctomycetes bacterium RBG_16_59_8]|nr:MAG: hypothetical protein A2Z34_08235 [Planctomycetes bacterium RBG_16_59_8]